MILERYNGVEDGLAVVGLSHSAAKHKMAVRPKKNHAAGRHRILPQVNHFFL